VCLSRVYLGLHSPLDIYGGVAVGLFLVGIFILVGDYIIVLASNSAWIFVVWPLHCIFLLAIYPSSGLTGKNWSSTYGDATRALGTSMGALFAAYFAYPGLKMNYTPTTMVFPVTASDWQFIVARIVIAMVIVVITKEVSKKVLYKIVPQVVEFLRIAPAKLPDIENKRRHIIEIPCVLIQYTLFTFNCFALTDGLLYKYIGLTMEHVK